jgi:hypothetical protein
MTYIQTYGARATITISPKEDSYSSSSINKRLKSPLVTTSQTGFNSSISEADRLVEKRRTLELCAWKLFDRTIV